MRGVGGPSDKTVDRLPEEDRGFESRYKAVPSRGSGQKSTDDTFRAKKKAKTVRPAGTRREHGQGHPRQSRERRDDQEMAYQEVDLIIASELGNGSIPGLLTKDDPTGGSGPAGRVRKFLRSHGVGSESGGFQLSRIG